MVDVAAAEKYAQIAHELSLKLQNFIASTARAKYGDQIS